MLDAVSARVKELYRITNSWETTVRILKWLSITSASEMLALISDFLGLPRGQTYPIVGINKSQVEEWRIFVEETTKGEPLTWRERDLLSAL